MKRFESLSEIFEGTLAENSGCRSVRGARSFPACRRHIFQNGVYLRANGSLTTAVLNPSQNKFEYSSVFSHLGSSVLLS